MLVGVASRDAGRHPVHSLRLLRVAAARRSVSADTRASRRGDLLRTLRQKVLAFPAASTVPKSTARPASTPACAAGSSNVISITIFHSPRSPLEEAIISLDTFSSPPAASGSAHRAGSRAANAPEARFTKRTQFRPYLNHCNVSPAVRSGGPPAKDAAISGLAADHRNLQGTAPPTPQRHTIAGGRWHRPSCWRAC